MGLKEASTLEKTSSIGPCVSTEHQLVTDRHRHRVTHGRPHTGQMGSADPPGKMDEKLKSENMSKKNNFQYFRMHHFVIKLSQFSSPQAARGH